MSGDPRQFLYRPGMLDRDDARRLAALHLSGCDDGELYLEYRAEEAFGFDDGRLKTADYSTSSGFGLRGVSGETTAFSHANEISAAAIERAASTLELLDPAKGAPAPPPARTNRSMYGSESPLAQVPFADKVALCQQIDAAARARDPRVAQVSVGLTASWRAIEIIRADGFTASDVRPLVRMGVQIVAADGNRREVGSFGLGGRYLYDRLFNPAVW
ncbi:MAG: metalloprotease TldD, partial [Sphingomonas sp.]|nr:metalloprotease TldD [Sphingomonas sp.]